MVPPPVPPCAGKESLMACHSSGRIVTVPVYVSWDAEMFPPKLKKWESTEFSVCSRPLSIMLMYLNPKLAN